MARYVLVYKKELGKFVEKGSEEDVGSNQAAPYVIDDTMAPIRNLHNDKTYDSKSAYLRDVKAAGMEVVGNDVLSKKPREHTDKITEEKVLDAVHRAEAIASDPTKLRYYREREQEVLAKRLELLNYGRR